MYIIKADGKLLYSPELIDDGYKVIAPRMHLEINAAGYLEFTIPPFNALYDDVLKMKSIITVEQDGEVVFRGRVSEESVDTYKQRRVYCEGDLSFLLDSLQAPCSFTGTQYDLFSQLIAAHNAQMDATKQFTLGDVSGLDREEVFSFDVTTYADTLSMVQSYLIDLFGGYIQTRTEDGVTYIDYVDGFVDECSQKIEFGVNLLNFESQINADELCTVLVPLGATLDDGTALTIASVNGGMVYIENPEAVERYGRVYKTYTWENVTDPAELLEMGMEYMQGAGLPETLSITALDMHLVDADVEKIRKGSMVHLLSKPHCIDKKIVCASIDDDLENADQTVFVLGLPKQRLKTLAEQVEEAATGLDGVISGFEDIYIDLEDTMGEVNQVSDKVEDHHRWLTETDTSLNIAVNTLDLIGHRVNQVSIDVDGAKAEIALRAFQSDMDVLGERMSGAEIRINGAEAAISLKAAQSTVDAMDDRLNTAEIAIDGLNSEIKLVATQKTIDDMVERLSAAEIEIDGLDAKIKLFATESSIEDLVTRITAAEIAIDGANSTLDLWAGELDAMGNRLSGAEVRINGAESAVEILAEEIRLAGYVKASDLETDVLRVINSTTTWQLNASSITAGWITTTGTANLGGVDTEFVNAGLGRFDTLYSGDGSVATEEWVEEQGYLKEIPRGTLEGFVTAEDVKNYCEPTYATQTHSHAVSVGSDGTITLGEVSSSGGSFNIADTRYYKDGVSAARTEGANGVNLTGMGWQGGANVVKASNGKSLTVNLPTFSVSGGDSFNSNHQSTVYFYTSSVNGPLKSKNVDATPVYNSGYDAGYSSGETTGYNVGYAQARPASVSRTTGYDASGNAYHVNVVVTSNDGTTRTYALEAISAREARNAGFNSGYDSGYTDGQASIDVMAYYDEGYYAGIASVDTMSYYNDGWNDCRDKCSLVTAYTISENSPGTLYMKVGDYYSSVGSSWVKVSRLYGVYTIPSAKS